MSSLPRNARHRKNGPHFDRDFLGQPALHSADNLMLSDLIRLATENGASDLHIEAGLPAALRIRGTLRMLDQPIPPKDTLAAAQSLLSPEEWSQFIERRSFDLSRTLQGVRCRINLLQTARGVGLAIRILASTHTTLESLNLHPDFRRLVQPTQGLLIVTGTTGSGKSSTVAALVEELNQSEPRHILTIESPIEFLHRPRRAYVRQREVGRDTPSFAQALLDALREDPDVMVVGEMREPETMHLTLNAAETGHLVITTLHSSSTPEALQRFVSAFPPEIQSAVRAQLADCLVGVLAQRLRYRADLKLRIPECELLLPTHAVKSHIRGGEFHKIVSALETGAEHGMWTFPRYTTWLDSRKSWHHGGGALLEGAELSSSNEALPPLIAHTLSPDSTPSVRRTAKITSGAPAAGAGRIEIEPIEGAVDELLRKLGPK